jgi:hypothetical protein
MTPSSEASADPVAADVWLVGFDPGRSFLSLSRWSPWAFVLLALGACGNRASSVTGSGSSSGTSNRVSAGTVTGTSAGASTGASAAAATGSGTGSGNSGSSGAGSTGMSSGGAGSSAMSGSSGAIVPVSTTFVNYELTGTWPALIAGTAANPIKQTPGALTYKMVRVGDRFLAESCSIADYNHDGIPDISSGRRWYEGPDFTTSHIYRSGHEAQPIDGITGAQALAGSVEFESVSDDWADYPFDMDGDGWPDIINIASPDGSGGPVVEGDTGLVASITAQQSSTGYWYKNPGNPANATDNYWTANLIGFDLQMEQRGLTDVDGDGKPEIFAACRACAGGGGTKGYYEGDWGNPTAPWTFHPVTRVYQSTFGGTGLMNGIGMGDIVGNGKPDLLERSGAWLQPATNPPTVETCVGYKCTPWQWVAQALSGGEGQPVDLSNNEDDTGGSHMFAYDVDGDGDMDIVGADSAFGWGLSWYEQTMPVTSCVGQPSSLSAGGLGGDGGTGANCFVKHQIIATNSAADLALYGVAFSELASAQVVDMDGDGLPDIITGKMFLAKAYDQGDPDNMGTPVLYVFKLVRDANPPQSGRAHFEPHLVNAAVPAVNTGDAGAFPATWTGGSGIGRQIAIGQINPQTDGIMDICIASKLGLYVYFGQ